MKFVVNSYICVNKININIILMIKLFCYKSVNFIN